MIEAQLWQIYQHSYFQGVKRQSPYHKITGSNGGAIISLWNPFDQTLSEEQNRRRTRAFMRYLRQKRYIFNLLWGGNEDMSYRELSVFIPCSKKQAQRLSAHFSQLAFYYVGVSGRVSLHCTQGTMPLCMVSKHLKYRWLTGP